MSRVVVLDRIISDRIPSLATSAEVAGFEKVPFAERVAARSTYDAIKLGGALKPDAPALQFLPNARADETPIVTSHREFLAQVTQAANLFHALGVGPNDVVSFLLPLIPEAFVSLFAAEATGIANPVNPLLEPNQIAEILRAAATKVLVALGPTPGIDIWQKVEKIRGDLATIQTVVQVGGRSDPETGFLSFDTLMARQPRYYLVSGRRIEGHETAAYFHTGGTTGTPKLVRHTHSNQVWQAWAINLMLKSEPGQNVLFGMPLYHVGGSLTQALSTFTSGGSLVVLSPSGWRNPAAVENLWRLVARYKPVVFSSVPTVLAASLAVPFNDSDVTTIRFTAGGGSAIPIAVGKALQERHGVPVLEVYGMTETSSVHTMAYPDREIRLGSVGHSVPYARVRIAKVDSEGRYLGDCAPNEIGIVAMAGPGVFSGYLNDAHNKGAFIEPGWVNSGDLGRLDEDGYLWITGRAKDLVIRGGHNIDPAPIEEAFFQHPAVGLAAVVGQPDAYAGELPVAYVQLKPGAKIPPGELEQWVRERTPERAAVPVEIIQIDAMPLTGVGKVFKPKLRWDAANRVFGRVLASLNDGSRQCEVSVGPDGTHGSLATVTVSGVPNDERAALVAEVGRRLAPFTLRHEVRWAD
jgi:fatty-acyl-CoA synthase